jgi:signal transduction histidine kinase
VQAIEGTGKINISTLSEKERISIMVEDTGCGINQANLSKIFDPFFTTKDPGKGTGLGLSITYNIVKEHGGDIEINSTQGIGTSVLIHFTINRPQVPHYK